FFFQAEDGIRDDLVTGVQTCALPILPPAGDLSCFCIRFGGIPLPIRRGVLRGCIPDSSPLPWPSPVSEWLGSPCSVCRRCRIPFMVRTAISHLFLRGILQLSHSRSPGA